MNKNTTPKHNLTVGTLLVCSWGYDQTNVNAYQVTRTTPSGVYVREIETEEVPGTNTGGMSNYVRVKKDSFRTGHTLANGNENKETFHRVINGGIKIKGNYHARVTTEDSRHFRSWYA